MFHALRNFEALGKLLNPEIQSPQMQNDNETIKCDGVFIYYGYQADTAFMRDLNITDDKGYIEVDKSMKTKIPFIYACGDIIKKDIYQIVTACSEGCIAALSLKKDINNEE